MERRTKIICTIGPKTSSLEMIRRLIEAGMNVARLNFSHGSHESHLEVIEIIKQVRKEFDHPIGILLDTKGPEIRVGITEEIEVVPKGRVRLVSKDPKEGEIPVLPGFIVDEVNEGVQILFADGYIRGFVVEKGDGWADVEIENKGVIKGGNGINIPSQRFNLPDMTEQDMLDIEFGCKQGVDFIAASFINTAKQLLVIREHINKCDGKSIQLIAKIESKLGVQNFDDILLVSDGIMVARGDLGVEVFVGLVPSIQKKLILECKLKAKPVIVATQMLDSMIQNPRPTRAEASDVANAVFDSCGALMLSGETAIGEYPIAATVMMHEIILATEKEFDYKEHFQKIQSLESHDITSAMAKAAVSTCFNVGATAIFTGSNSGRTARYICRYRPSARIIVVTPKESTFFQTSMLWGVECFREKKSDIMNSLTEISSHALQKDWVSYGDLLVITLGTPYGVSLTTNTITVESVGHASVRGQPMEEEEIVPITGEICFFLSLDETQCPDFQNKIVIVNRLERKAIPLFQNASAIVLQNHPYDVRSEELLQEIYEQYKIPYIYRAVGASTLLAAGDIVKIHPAKGLIFPEKSPTEEQMRKMKV